MTILLLMIEQEGTREKNKLSKDEKKIKEKSKENKMFLYMWL